MHVLSTLCRIGRASNALKVSNVSRILLTKEKDAFMQAFRNMSGGDEDRTMYITPSRFSYTKFKDSLHFYVTLGVVPLGLLILYVNIFIGPATLTEIPEGYEPKHWEYYKHPISRFISKNFLTDQQIDYERNLHCFNEEQEKLEWSEKISKVKKLMAERDDYKAWYFIESGQGRRTRYARKQSDEVYERKGYI